MVKLDKVQYLKDLGLKEALLAKLHDEQLQEIIEYALDHHDDANLTKNLIMLCSLELKGKVGAIFLVKNNLATITQIKNLHSEQIDAIIVNFTECDLDSVSCLYNTKKEICDCIVLNQHINIANHTGVNNIHDFYSYQDDEYRT